MGDGDGPRTRPPDPAGTPRGFPGGGGGGPTNVGRSPRWRGSEELCLAASTSSARVARHWVMNEIAAEEVFGADNQIVELLTGELVANAALHGPSDGMIRVRAWRAGNTVRVAVRDDSGDIPVVRHPEPTAPSGRGLELVDSLAADWGVEHHGTDGKTVWFSVDLDPD